MTVLYWSVEYLVTLIEAITCCFFKNIFIGNKQDNYKNNRIRICIYSVFASLLVMVINQIHLSLFINGILKIIMLCILQFIIYKRRHSFLILLTLVYAVVDLAIDFVIVQTAEITFNIKASYLLNEQSLERCGCVIISKLILCIIIYFIYKYNQNKFDISKKHILLICFISIVLISLDCYIVENSATTDNTQIKLFFVVFFIVSIILIILIFNLVLKLAENYKQKQDIVLLKLKNEMIVKSEKNTEHAFNLWRSSIHDYKYKVFAMKHWLDEGNIKEVKDFIEKESESLTQKVFYIKTGNDAVDAIVNKKQNIAEEKGITFSVNIVMPPSCRVSDIDFVCILGNLIDNAIEACEKQNKKYIEIIVKEIKKILIIKVINSYKDRLADEFVTTKKEKSFHGIGLKNVRSIVEKYDGTYEMINDNNEIVIKIMILNK